MKASEETLGKLEIKASAEKVANGHFDRFPPLVMDRCLSKDVSSLANHVHSQAGMGYPIAAEVLAMPRRRFGARPVTMTSPTVRTLYNSLVDFLTKESNVSDRTNDKWTSHEQFGVPTGSTDDFYLVDIDIASCYEYVEHDSLARQLSMESSDVAEIKTLTSLLGEIMERPRGLPQLSPQSDVLADIYLSVIEREIAREGYRVSRIADDFKIMTGSWSDANQIIEVVAERARTLGLVLSTEKTNIRRSHTVLGSRQEEAEFLNKHFDMARTPTVDFIFGPYGEPESVEIPQGTLDVIRGAMWYIVDEWYRKRNTTATTLHAKHIGNALTLLSRHVDRLDDDILKEIVFRMPIRLDSVCRYLMSRQNEVEENWKSLRTLASMGRQSAWAKIWLLHTADSLTVPSQGAGRWAIDWTKTLANDRHETVRSEAAWTLSGWKSIDQSEVARLFGRASGMTRPAIAAAAGRMKVKLQSPVGQAILGDSRLMNPAYKWGENGGA
ncbi:reverse transcriptase domain-containing protein [Amycolatopsis keratiniphila]|uniref:reverse transcriptase domain-containing protein n=1 Tax=Amycolatopsis keratiniphila TaxID=129921 RepID=UPI000F51081E|nr:reverse transcriptase domain-containing protein [Amycolatopsis keratiniphila]